MTATYLIARSTCDDFMWPLIKKKLKILYNVGLESQDENNKLIIEIDQNSTV